MAKSLYTLHTAVIVLKDVLETSNMSEKQVISNLSRRAAARLFWQRSIQYLASNLFVAFGVAVGLVPIAVCLAYVYDELSSAILLCSLAMTVALAGLGKALFHILNMEISVLEGAKTLDDRLGLKDRFSSALHFEQHQSGDMTAITLTDVQNRARALDLGGAMPLSIPGQAFGIALFVLVCLPMAQLLSEYKTPATRAFDADVAKKDRDKEVLEKVKSDLIKAAEEIDEEDKANENEAGAKASKMLKKAAQEIGPEQGNDRQSALRKLADKRKEIKKELNAISFEEALKKAISYLVKSKYTRPLARKLQKSDFDGAIASTLELAETLPEAKLNKKETDKLVTAAGRASKVLKPTKLKPLGDALADLAEAVRLKDKNLMKKALKKMAKNMKLAKKINKNKQSRKALLKALDALKMAKFDLSKGLQGDLKHEDFKTVKGKGNKGEGKARPLPIRPGPMRKGGGQGPKGNNDGKREQYLGPCSLSCGFEGQCMKCPCRGKKNCPTVKKPCPCRHCQSRQGQGQGQGKGQGQGQGQGKGKGGKKPGWGSDKKYVKPEDLKGLARKTHIKGILGKSGESALKAVKTANDGSKASTALKTVIEKYRKVEEEALHRGKVPLSKRDLVRKYFEAIKPKDEN